MQLKATPEDFIVRELLVPKPAAGTHSLYLLRKRLWNTEDCLQWLSKSLRTPRKRLGCCGNKDRRAVTEQYVTIEHGPRTVRTPEGCDLAYLGAVQERLRLGDHEGNWFCITVRGLPDGAQPRIGPVKNYYGEQRFGKANADVGFLLLRKRYAEAATALGLPFTTDPVGALRTLPKHTLLLYGHAAQSRLWNELAATLPAEQADVPIVGFGPGGNGALLPLYEPILARYGLTRDAWINKSIPELSLEGGSRPLLQDVREFSASGVSGGACTVCFGLGKGSYATETVRQLFG